jgi:hypothetical protein
VGFTTGDIEELERQVTFAAAGATQIAAGPETGYAVWEDSSGAALWIQVADRAITGAQPFFAPAARHEARVEAALPDAEQPLDGGARLYVLPDEKSILRVDVLNFALVSRALRQQAIVPIRLAGFAESVRFYPTEEEYAASHAEAKRQGVRWIVPTGLYPADKGGTDRATAMVTGVVREAEERVNSITQSPFLRLRLETAGFALDAVCAAGPRPEPGAIAHGHFWLAAVVQPHEPGAPLRLR